LGLGGHRDKMGGAGAAGKVFGGVVQKTLSGADERACAMSGEELEE
jgi:hypothetical protein